MDHAGRRPAANGGWVVDPGSGRGSGFHRRTGPGRAAITFQARPSLSQRPGEKHATVARRARPARGPSAKSNNGGNVLGLRPSLLRSLVLRSSVHIAILIFVKI